MQSKPVEEFYTSRGKLQEFDLPGGISESWPKLLEALNIEDSDHKQSAAAWSAIGELLSGCTLDIILDKILVLFILRPK